jgi:hypothetical protein
MSTTDVPPVPWTGIVIQSNRAKIPGATKDARLDWCKRHADEAVALGIAGIAWHGFSTELLPDRFAQLAHVCTERGMVALAAFGMDSDDPEGKAKRIAAVSQVPACAGVVLDWEGKWEDEPNDPAKAEAFARVYADKVRAGVFTADQPWWKPTVHWRSPYEEFGRVCHARFRQNYCNDYEGKDRYERINRGSDDAWTKLNARLGPKGLLRPVLETRQAYGWADIPASLEQCLLDDDPVILWAEAWPDAQVIAALRAHHARRCVAQRGPVPGA